MELWIISNYYNLLILDKHIFTICSTYWHTQFIIVCYLTIYHGCDSLSSSDILETTESTLNTTACETLSSLKIHQIVHLKMDAVMEF